MKGTWQLIHLAWISLALATSMPARAGDAACDRQEVLAHLAAGAAGHGLLCSHARGISAPVLARGLVPGHACTVWWVYFDDPGQCESPGACGALSDFAGQDPLGFPAAVVMFQADRDS